jgi:hypothetical protein
VHGDLASPGLVSDFKEHGDLRNFSLTQPSYDRLSMVSVTIRLSRLEVMVYRGKALPVVWSIFTI